MADIDAAKRRDGRSTASIDEHRLGLDRVYVQTKRLADTKTVGRPEVQGFVGSLVGLGATKDDAAAVCDTRYSNDTNWSAQALSAMSWALRRP